MMTDYDALVFRMDYLQKCAIALASATVAYHQAGDATQQAAYRTMRDAQNRMNEAAKTLADTL